MDPVRISVIIVSYNVRFFLEQCLQSVKRAARDIPAEVFVVDNDSADGSCMMVRDNFPGVVLIENKDNVGFSKANNQAMRLASGEFVLILNPDTVVEEDAFHKILDFMDNHPDAGALGVKMIDGKGRFLPESKRSLPTPAVSFYKMSGLSALFPKSRKFGRYHLGFLSPEEVHAIDILPGAFMFIRKTVLDRVGLFDESYFMYGEDIDLSYRILQAGYRNYYFPGTTIIHYKGESTRKGSVNYVLMFYQAMIIFANKYFSRSNARWFSLIIKLSVYFRAALSLLRRLVARFSLPLLDAAIIFAGFVLINPLWESFKFSTGGHHPPEFLRVFVPAYILVWLVSIYFSGGYDQPVRIRKIVRGILYGTALILVIYSLLPEIYRFSRALILLGSIWVFFFLILERLILHFLRFPGFALDLGARKRTAIVGREAETDRISRLLGQTGRPVQVVGFINPDENNLLASGYLGTLSQIREIIRINHVDEIIFCSRDLSINEIIRNMLNLGSMQTDYKIAPDATDSIIGSNSINRSGDLYVIPIHSVGEPQNRRLKRLFDFMTALVLLALSPVVAWFYWPRSLNFLWNCILVLSGKRSWIGYHPDGMLPGYHLPAIKKGIMPPAGRRTGDNTSTEGWLDSNLRYARDFTMYREFVLFFRSFGNLGDRM